MRYFISFCSFGVSHDSFEHFLVVALSLGFSNDSTSINVTEGSLSGEFSAWDFVLEADKLSDVLLSTGVEWSPFFIIESSVVIVTLSWLVISVPMIPLIISILGRDSADEDECDLSKFHFFLI